MIAAELDVINAGRGDVINKELRGVIGVLAGAEAPGGKSWASLAVINIQPKLVWGLSSQSWVSAIIRGVEAKV